MGHACDVLQTLGDNKHRPGVVSTLVALFTNMENTDDAVEVLDQAVDWYKSQGVRFDRFFPFNFYKAKKKKKKKKIDCMSQNL